MACEAHFHMLWLDGVYDANVEPPQRKPRLHRARAPTSAQLTQLANTIAHRVCRHLARKGWLEGEDERNQRRGHHFAAAVNGHHFAAAVNGHERDSPDPGPN
jgi:hypothetical protein